MDNNSFVTIFEDSNYAISYDETGSDSFLISFSGENGLLGGLNGVILGQEEFVKSTNGASRIFIKNKTRHAGQMFHWDTMPELILKYADGRKMSALGNSSGAMSAIYLSTKIKIDTIIGFNPIYTTWPDETSEEYRVSHYDVITKWEYKNLDNCFDTDTQMYLFMSKTGLDEIHNKRFPNKNNVNKFLFTDEAYTHYTARQLRDYGILHDIIKMCIDQKDKNLIHELCKSKNIDMELG